MTLTFGIASGRSGTRRREADGGFASGDFGNNGGSVDYDLGYGADGWDTDGFRSPQAGSPGQITGARIRPATVPVTLASAPRYRPARARWMAAAPAATRERPAVSGTAGRPARWLGAASAGPRR